MICAAAHVGWSGCSCRRHARSRSQRNRAKVSLSPNRHDYGPTARMTLDCILTGRTHADFGSAPTSGCPAHARHTPADAPLSVLPPPDAAATAAAAAARASPALLVLLPPSGLVPPAPLEAAPRLLAAAGAHSSAARSRAAAASSCRPSCRSASPLRCHPFSHLHDRRHCWWQILNRT